MSAELRIEGVDASRVRVVGSMGFADAAAAYGRSDEITRGRSGAVQLDVGRLERIDSATLAVLLAWAANAAGEGIRLTLSEVPADLKALAHLCDAEAILGIA